MPSNNSNPQYSQAKTPNDRDRGRAFLLHRLADPAFLEGLAADPPLIECYYRLGVALGLPARRPRRDPPKVAPPGADQIAWQLILLWRACGLSRDRIAELLVRLDDTPMWPPLDRLAILMRDAGL